MGFEGKNLVGVDIGSAAIKVCEISESRRGVRTITRYEHHALPPETIVDGHIINSGAVIDVLEAAFHKSRRRDVALRASGHSVIIKKISLPLMTANELAEQIGWEAEQHIPFDLKDVRIDYQVLRRHESVGQMSVLLVAAKKEEIADLASLAHDAKLKPVVVDLDAFAVQNCFEAINGGLGERDSVVLIHVGAAATTINVVAEGTTAFTRDIANGGNLVTEEIQRQIGVSSLEAESYKLGGDGTGIIPEPVPGIIRGASEQLAGEIQRSLDFYLATSGAGSLGHVVCSGGGANSQALLSAISSRAGVSVKAIDVLQVGTVSAAALSSIERFGPQGAVAIGLALRKERERN